MNTSIRKTAARKAAPAAKKAAPPVRRPAVATKPEQAKEKADKAKKPKVVRDSFTFPKDEYAALAQLKQRAIGLAHPIKKGELLRAGIKALSAMSDTAFLQTLRTVPSIKTGRPKKA